MCSALGIEPGLHSCKASAFPQYSLSGPPNPSLMRIPGEYPGPFLGILWGMGTLIYLWIFFLLGAGGARCIGPKICWVSWYEGQLLLNGFSYAHHRCICRAILRDLFGIWGLFYLSPFSFCPYVTVSQ